MAPIQTNDDETSQTIVNINCCVGQYQNIAGPAKTTPIMGTNKKSKSNLEQQHAQGANTYLNIDVIQKILDKFLTEKTCQKKN